jgi:hypothetical protein
MASVPAQEIAPGLARWLAPHPDWHPECDWAQLVGSVLYELEDVVALIDPLLPLDGREQFLAWLDERIAGRPVSILTTIRWHTRDRELLADRYRAQTRPRAWNRLPAGVAQRPLRGAGETLYWLVRAQTLVAGDSVLGDGRGGLVLCPESWLQDVIVDRRGLARLLQAQLELPIDRVLASHGDPVLQDGRAVLAHAIAQAE